MTAKKKLASPSRSLRGQIKNLELQRKALQEEIETLKRGHDEALAQSFEKGRRKGLLDGWEAAKLHTFVWTGDHPVATAKDGSFTVCPPVFAVIKPLLLDRIEELGASDIARLMNTVAKNA